MNRQLFHYDAVLSPDVPRDTIRAVLMSRGGTRNGSIPRGETQLAEEVWRFENGDQIRIVCDHFVDITSLRAESTTPGRPAQMISELYPQLNLRDENDLVALSVSPVVADRSHAIRGLAAILGRFRSDVTDAITKGLTDPDRSLRDDALRAIARWPHFVFVKPLEAMAKRESDAELRAEAKRLAVDVRKHGRRGF